MGAGKPVQSGLGGSARGQSTARWGAAVWLSALAACSAEPGAAAEPDVPPTPDATCEQSECRIGTFYACVDGHWAEPDHCALSEEYCSATLGCVEKPCVDVVAPCALPGARQCVPEQSDAVRRCEGVDGCLRWVVTACTPSEDPCLGPPRCEAGKCTNSRTAGCDPGGAGE